MVNPHSDKIEFHPPRQVSEHYELHFTAYAGSPSSMYDPGESEHWEPDHIIIVVGENKWFASDAFYLYLLEKYASGLDCLVGEHLLQLRTEAAYAYAEHLMDMKREEVPHERYSR